MCAIDGTMVQYRYFRSYMWVTARLLPREEASRSAWCGVYARVSPIDGSFVPLKLPS